jgi:hypothetical protein
MATRTLEDWKSLNSNLVVDFAFSTKGEILYFIEDRKPNSGTKLIIWEYNITSKAKT